MKWCKRISNLIRIVMATIKIPMSGKPKRPRIQKIIFVEIIDGEFVTSDKWIIVNERGETLEAPIFSSKKEAEEWLDEYYPKHNYAPE